MDCHEFRFIARKSTIDLRQLRQLLADSAFWGQQRNLADLRTAVANSNPVISVWCGERMIGFARATSDAVYRATIWDVVVHPDFQGLGLGREIVERISAHPLLSEVERIYLMTSYQQSFYEKLGFKLNHTTTMVAYGTKDRSRCTEPTSQEKPPVSHPNAAVA